MFFLFAPFSEEPEVFFPKYYQTTIVHAAHFRRVVKLETGLNVRFRATGDKEVLQSGLDGLS